MRNSADNFWQKKILIGRLLSKLPIRQTKFPAKFQAIQFNQTPKNKDVLMYIFGVYHAVSHQSMQHKHHPHAAVNMHLSLAS